MVNTKYEYWIDLKNYEGYYKISNLGRLKSVDRYQFCKKNNSNSLITGKVLKFTKNKYGYYKTTICKEKVRSQVLIHRLVLNSFCEEPIKNKVVNHINGCRLDNSVSNLEWVSFRENSCHSKIGVKKTSKYIGVYWCKKSRKWRCQISISLNKKRRTIYLGLFELEIDAFKARVVFEKENNIENKYLSIT